jgi:hypothetical protein
MFPVVLAVISHFQHIVSRAIYHLNFALEVRKQLVELLLREIRKRCAGVHQNLY